MSGPASAVSGVRWEPLVDPWLLAAGVAVALVAVLVPVLRRRRDRAGWPARALLVAVVGVLLAHPLLLGRTVTTAGTVPDRQVLVVLDRTTSMAATDGPGGRTRLEAARADLAVLTERLEGARFGLVVWGREVEEVVPATADRVAFLDAVARTTPEDPRAGTGSTVDRPLPVVVALLRRTARQHPERGSLVLLLTDGEDTTGRPAAGASGDAPSWRAVGALSDGGAVLGYGTEAGATMPRADLPGAPPVVDPRTGAPAVSRLDPATLRRVAGQLEVPYVERGPSADPAALRDLAARLPEPEAVVERAVPTPADPAWALAGLTALLGLVELRRWARDLQETRRAGRP